MTTTQDGLAADPAAEEGTDLTGSGAREESTRRYTRSPVDVLRLVVFGVLALTLIAITIWVEDAIVGVEEDLIALFGFLSSSGERVLHGALEIFVILIAVVVYLLPIINRRLRLFGYLLASSALAFVVMHGAQWLIDRETTITAVNELARRSGLTDTGSAAGSVGVAQTTAFFIALAPFVTRRWRRAGAVTIALLVFLRLLVSVRLPAELFVALPVGAFCGTAVLLAFGRPDRRPTVEAIQSGTGLFVKVLGSQERAADLLFRFYRFLRFKNVGDDRPFSSLRRTIEHEALIALLARDVGVRTPRLRGIVDVGSDSMLLTYEMIDGSSLDGIAGEELTDELMTAIWQQIADLRSHRIAHRDLRRANVFIGDDAVPWMIDFGFSEVAVPDTMLDADVAQMLASLAVVVGAERAVEAAVGVLGPEAVGASLPRLQSKALSGATQESLKQHPGLLKELQSTVVDRCAVDDVEFVELERISRNMIVTIVVLTLATYFLLPQLADLPGIVDQVREANWAWAPLIILASTTTYFAASLSVAGAVPPRLPAGPLFMSSVGSSFASKLAPAGLGGMALNVRFLQKQGIDQAVAVSGVGLNTIAGLVGHISLVVVFLVWAGREAFGSFELPDPKWFLIAVGAAAALILIGFAIPFTRRLIVDKLLPILARSFDGMQAVLRRPGKIAMLIGGSALVTFSYLTTLYFSVEAFGGGLPFATVGAVFLVGSAVAQAAPTPGGLGAMEAALIAGLVSAGLDNTVAVPAVFLYRLFTFWVPILPGWLSFQWLERNDYL